MSSTARKPGESRHVSGFCAMPLRAVVQHRHCPLEVGGGAYNTWTCHCECHDEGYVEPVNGAMVEPTPGYAIPRGYTEPEKPRTRTNENKGTSTYSQGTKVGTHWYTGATGGSATAWVEVPLEERLKNRIALTSKRGKK